MELTLNKLKGLEILQAYASQWNANFTEPPLDGTVWVCRHKVAVKIPDAAQAQDTMIVAYDYLKKYMELAELNSREEGAEPGEVVFEEIQVAPNVDNLDNTYDGFLTIAMQRYIK